jgi:MFS family permease
MLFIYVEKKVKHPMLDLSLFRNRPFLAGNLSGLLSFIAMFSSVILLPFFLTNIKGLSPSQVGLIITPFPLVMGIISPLSGDLSDRVSPAYLTTLGLSITAAGLVMMSRITGETPITYIALIQALMGLGSGLFQSPNNNSVISSVAKEKMGIAGGISALMRNFGMVTGTAAAVSIFENQRLGFLQDISAPTTLQTTSAFLHGYHTAIMAGAIVAAIGAVISMNRKGHTFTEK